MTNSDFPTITIPHPNDSGTIEVQVCFGRHATTEGQIYSDVFVPSITLIRDDHKVWVTVTADLSEEDLAPAENHVFIPVQWESAGLIDALIEAQILNEQRTFLYRDGEPLGVWECAVDVQYRHLLRTP